MAWLEIIFKIYMNFFRIGRPCQYDLNADFFPKWNSWKISMYALINSGFRFPPFVLCAIFNFFSLSIICDFEMITFRSAATHCSGSNLSVLFQSLSNVRNWVDLEGKYAETEINAKVFVSLPLFPLGNATAEMIGFHFSYYIFLYTILYIIVFLCSIFRALRSCSCRMLFPVKNSFFFVNLRRERKFTLSLVFDSSSFRTLNLVNMLKKSWFRPWTASGSVYRLITVMKN